MVKEKFSKVLFDDHVMKECDVKITTKNTKLYTTSKFLSYVSKNLKDLLLEREEKADTSSTSPTAAASVTRTLTRTEFIKEHLKSSAKSIFPPDSYTVCVADGEPDEDDNETKEISVETMLSENVETVLKFYRPKYYSGASITGMIFGYNF